MIERTITVDGLEIRYLEEGEGPAVLLLHGGTLGFSCDVWRRNMTPLAQQGFRVIAYDQPGFGLSDAPQDFGLRYRQGFITKFLDALKITKASLVGHSQAGGLVIGAALETPDRFPGVVVLGTGSLLPPSAGQTRDVDIPTQEPSLEETRALLQANLFRHELITPDLLAAYHQMSIGRNFTNAARRAEAAPKGGGKPLWQRLGEVTVPLLFIYGTNDRGRAAERVLLARETYPRLTFQLLDGCHHILQWDRPDDVVQSIGAFLADLPTKWA